MFVFVFVLKLRYWLVTVMLCNNRHPLPKKVTIVYCMGTLTRHSWIHCAVC